jgi:hypothetical protein
MASWTYDVDQDTTGAAAYGAGRVAGGADNITLSSAESDLSRNQLVVVNSPYNRMPTAAEVKAAAAPPPTNARSFVRGCGVLQLSGPGRRHVTVYNKEYGKLGRWAYSLVSSTWWHFNPKTKVAANRITNVRKSWRTNTAFGYYFKGQKRYLAREYNAGRNYKVTRQGLFENRLPKLGWLGEKRLTIEIVMLSNGTCVARGDAKARW